MGMVNAQRSLNVMRTITEFITQPQYKNVVVMFGVINEASTQLITMPIMTSL